VPFPPGACGDDRGELEGVAARLITLVALRLGKASPRDDPEDAAKDRADAATLEQRRGRQGGPA
jgi:hypothetical protein